MDTPSIRVMGFRTTYTKKEGMSELVARDLVKYAPVHAINTVTEEFISHLRPPENDLDRDDTGLKAGHMQALWGQIEPYYNAWKKGTEVPETGVPLSNLRALITMHGRRARRFRKRECRFRRGQA